MRRSKSIYILVDSSGRLETVRSFRDALEKAVEMKPPVRIYRGVLVARFGVEELRELSGLRVGERSGRRAGAREQGGGEGRATLVVAVFDQMFRGFGEAVKRELGDAVEVHEVVGRGLEETVEAEGVYYEPATSDYDVIKLVERLAREKRLPVVLFTGDKKLAKQAAMLEGVRVVYMPPSEIPGKEIALKKMLETLQSVVREAWGL